MRPLLARVRQNVDGVVAHGHAGCLSERDQSSPHAVGHAHEMLSVVLLAHGAVRWKNPPRLQFKIGAGRASRGAYGDGREPSLCPGKVLSCDGTSSRPALRARPWPGPWAGRRALGQRAAPARSPMFGVGAAMALASMPGRPSTYMTQART